MLTEFDSTGLCEERKKAGLIHPVYGDMNDGRVVELVGVAGGRLDYQASSPYFVHISTTGRCNARCKGCINSCITYKDVAGGKFLSSNFDFVPKREASAVIDLLSKAGETDAAVCLYGGEPLLLCEELCEFVEFLGAYEDDYNFRYMLYTNGQLLGRAAVDCPELIKKVWLFSVSIDGGREQHNSIRLGTDLDEIHGNLGEIAGIRTGKVLVWSTLREEQSLADCFDEFMYLYDNSLADLFFYHWVETPEPFDDIEGFAERYERDLRVIMEAFTDKLEQGQILPIVHICELVLYILAGSSRNSTACGVELARNFDILGGKILTCSDMGLGSAIGHIDDDGVCHITEPDLMGLVKYKDYLGCKSCGVVRYCGGRCPVQAMNSTPRRLVQYCQLMRLHTAIVQEYTDVILKAIRDNDISLQQIYDESAYYAQFTDVTP